jgi:hypothetical protein
MRPSPAFVRVVLRAITEAVRAGAETISDTLTTIALREGVSRSQVHAAIADARRPIA